MPDSVLIANRGEIARRVIKTVRRLGMRAIAVYSEADAELPFVAEADEALLIGPAPARQSYLNVDAILAATSASGAQAIHPGYGFLAENAEFAAKVIDTGLIWIGPSPAAIEQMGDKIRARNLMAAAGVPVAAGGTEPVADSDAAVSLAKDIGFPVMIKAAAGGGGIGMTVASDEQQLRSGFETARSRAERFFASPDILIERYVASARHVEIQILGLADGRVIALGERDCSVQRRHQKVAEETPSPGVGEELRQRMFAAAIKAGEAVGYRGAGTVECLVDTQTGEFMFLEMNTRLQVEHAVTEMVTGIDLVEQQLLVAAGADVSFDVKTVHAAGHALELRIYAEDPVRFLPSPGTITQWSEPSGDGVRVDAGYVAGNTVTQHYDPLLAKLVLHAADRASAIELARRAVGEFVITGLKTNLPFHAELLGSDEFGSGKYDTSVVSRLRP